MKDLIKGSDSTLYMQLWEKRIRVTDIDSGRIFDEAPLVAIRKGKRRGKRVALGNRASSASSAEVEVINPFSHPRSLLAHFKAAELLLEGIFEKLGAERVFSSPANLVLQPMEKNQGGLTEVEVRAFQELGLGAGARRVYVYQGPELTRHTLDLSKVREASAPVAASGAGEPRSWTQWIWIAIWFILIAVMTVFQQF
ncbi:rod shape-determining protein [Microbulbifer guangxiensis]|uniref:rod shape-determining protein n=1 Tax=Microbulbifer guangxiensis TaxID=2904249 RepID=UPI001F4834EF|nr:rod shape-determining protein [Microbulbifer guangxiensis]